MLMAWREGACGWAWWLLTLAMATSWAHKFKLAALLVVVLFLKVASLADVGYALLNVALALPRLAQRVVLVIDTHVAQFVCTATWRRAVAVARPKISASHSETPEH